jgi:Multiubiquitin
MENNFLNDKENFHSQENILRLVIEGKNYDWTHQYITGAEIKALANIPSDYIIILAIEKPWEDEIIGDSTKVDLARPGIEHFYARKHGEGVLVSIFINYKEYKIKRGKYSIQELKKVGGIQQRDELEELINGKLVPLKDDSILIKGGEQFFSHVPDGSSS